jgi:hypothetical protein
MNEIETKLALMIGQQAMTIAALQVQLEQAQKAATPAKPVAVVTPAKAAEA